MTEPTSKVIQVHDLHNFVFLLMSWHAEKVSMLEHMLEIPDGTELTLDDSSTFTVAGDFKSGFKAGLALALIELGHLPFIAETEDEVDPSKPKPSVISPGNDDAVH